ncbi:hypothetical protein Y032_0526g2947 [Ancylostoma ceylanicum]|uniref:Reverse transcriptase domain-containing protein n=1 Tax=Ancylostoma ceylanicum TaxID=53326 RepID=A0A016WS11_9BILA|nr:hypothetical protein Y032_0526g2947 [Ancylostoma ceylanicum]
MKRTKTQFMKNMYCEGERIELEESHITATSSYVYLGRSMNMENNLKEQLDRRRRAVWAAFGLLWGATYQLADLDLRAHLFDFSVVPALCYAAETWADTVAMSKTLRTIHRGFEPSLLRCSRRTQHQARLRSSDLRQIFRLRDPEEYVSKAKYRWVGHSMRREDDSWTKRTGVDSKRYETTTRGPPMRWADMFTARMN